MRRDEPMMVRAELELGPWSRASLLAAAVPALTLTSETRADSNMRA